MVSMQIMIRFGVMAAGLLLVVFKAPPINSAQPSGPLSNDPAQLFTSSADCLACHNNLMDASGMDLSIGTDWRSTMMANSARDPYWQAAVRREILDHPDAALHVEDECSICHMPMARYTDNTNGRPAKIFSHLEPTSPSSLAPLALDGVSCTVCHQIADANLDNLDGFVGRFTIDTQTPTGNRRVFGPYDTDTGRNLIMRSASQFEPQKARHIRASRLCASCHTLYTQALDPNGKPVGRLPEQTPYLEWLHSRYTQSRSCQACHMLPAQNQVHATSVWGKPRDDFKRHVFRGGNFLMPLVFNRNRKDLGITATPKELQATSNSAKENLGLHAARLRFQKVNISPTHLDIQLEVKNLAGHKLPSAYPSRRSWIHIVVRDARGKPIFESGRYLEDGSIMGNDNDTDPTAFEPHYSIITSSDQVQIYEPILGDRHGAVTTGLLTASGYLKDNRLLPAGFDKSTAHADIAVWGQAMKDDDFQSGGDEIVYRISLDNTSKPYTIEAKLLYQPIGYRWAHNLKAYPSAETQRFVRYFSQAARDSSIVLDKSTHRTP